MTSLFDIHFELAETRARAFTRRRGWGFDQLHQEALIGLWNAAKTWRPGFDATFETYAFWKMNSCLMDFVRGRKGREPVFCELRDRPARQPRADDRLIVQDLVSALDWRRRKIILLKIEGYDHQSIADILDLSEGFVCREFKAGLKEIRERIA